MKVIKGESAKTYYKYAYTDWTQPRISSAGTMGGSSFACSASSYWQGGYEYVKAFDSSTSSSWISSPGTSWLKFYSPTPIIVKAIKLVEGWTESSVKFYGSNSNGNWTLLGSDSRSIVGGSNASATVTIDCSQNDTLFTYYYILFDGVSTNSSNCYFRGISDVTITAKTKTVQQGTAQDYDYFVEHATYKMPTKENGTKYCGIRL